MQGRAHLPAGKTQFCRWDCSGCFSNLLVKIPEQGRKQPVFFPNPRRIFLSVPFDRSSGGIFWCILLFAQTPLTGGGNCYKIYTMSYVFFDLEWNQGYPRNEAEKIDEIIQIGAYRLDNWQADGVLFSAYVRPSIHRKLHHQVKKMLPLDQAQLKKAAPFQKVAADFFAWCGEHAVFFTWGTSDARVLDSNLCWYGMEEYLDLEIYDLQRAFDLLVLQTNHQTALETAVAALGLDAQLEYHDAGNDAAYTAWIAAELVRRFGALPTEEELDRQETILRERLRQEAARQADEALETLWSEQEPLLRRRSSHFDTAEECLKSRGVRVFHCPGCENWLCNGNWYQVEGRYVARSRCMEHGRFFSCLDIQPDGQGKLQGELRVYSEEQFPRELFQQCKLGGKRIEVCQMPRKRRRIRKRKSKIEARS